VSSDSPRAVRLFIGDGSAWEEVTTGTASLVRISAADLQQAQRIRRRIRARAERLGDDPDSIAVILDVTAAIAYDFRTARKVFEQVDPPTVRYAGTHRGLAGLIADIFVAGVADGVTLLSGMPGTELRVLAGAVLAQLAQRVPVRRAA
jgi:alkanesulfonate monooxygenase SsuD/methylene tetrahydromethanopterin reductase-like flavin-dependent oxidoreductase (luciferase family)